VQTNTINFVYVKPWFHVKIKLLPAALREAQGAGI